MGYGSVLVSLVLMFLSFLLLYVPINRHQTSQFRQLSINISPSIKKPANLTLDPLHFIAYLLSFHPRPLELLVFGRVTLSQKRPKISCLVSLSLVLSSDFCIHLVNQISNSINALSLLLSPQSKLVSGSLLLVLDTFESKLQLIDVCNDDFYLLKKRFIVVG
jgi:hypothetical protein